MAKNDASARVHELGKVTVFHVPSHKLDDGRFFGKGEKTARSAIHSFLINAFRAYTHTPTPVKGYWTGAQNELVHDVMERFEVSFEKEVEFENLLSFLGELCVELEEDAIYVTRGDRSFLVARGG